MSIISTVVFVGIVVLALFLASDGMKASMEKR